MIHYQFSKASLLRVLLLSDYADIGLPFQGSRGNAAGCNIATLLSARIAANLRIGLEDERKSCSTVMAGCNSRGVTWFKFIIYLQQNSHENRTDQDHFFYVHYLTASNNHLDLFLRQLSSNQKVAAFLSVAYFCLSPGWCIFQL